MNMADTLTLMSIIERCKEALGKQVTYGEEIGCNDKEGYTDYELRKPDLTGIMDDKTLKYWYRSYDRLNDPYKNSEIHLVYQGSKPTHIDEHIHVTERVHVVITSKKWYVEKLKG